MIDSYFSVERSGPFFQRNSLSPGAIHNNSRRHTVRIAFSKYTQTAFIHATPKAISGGTLLDRYHQDHRIKPIDGDNDDNDDDGHGNDKNHSFTEKTLRASSSFELFRHFLIYSL